MAYFMSHCKGGGGGAYFMSHCGGKWHISCHIVEESGMFHVTKRGGGEWHISCHIVEESGIFHVTLWKKVAYFMSQYSFHVM